MKRTSGRPPWPARLFHASHALVFGLVLSVASFFWLWWTTNLLSAPWPRPPSRSMLIYTLLLKRRTSAERRLGRRRRMDAEMIGWSAVTGPSPGADVKAEPRAIARFGGHAATMTDTVFQMDSDSFPVLDQAMPATRALQQDESAINVERSYIHHLQNHEPARSPATPTTVLALHGGVSLHAWRQGCRPGLNAKNMFAHMAGRVYPAAYQR